MRVLPIKSRKERIMALKSNIRQEFRVAINAMTAEQKKNESETICNHLIARFNKERPRVVAAFFPLPSEPDIWPALRWVQENGQLLLPRMIDTSLCFHVVEEDIQMIEGPYGIREPNPTLPRVDPVYFDVALVPGLAFTRTGDRLGRGRGYYDRFIASLPDRTRRIGVAFRCQMTENVPLEAHDLPVHEVVQP